MAISRMKPENQVALLRDAAKKVRTTRIPHIIDESRWVARPANNIKHVQREDELFFPLGENIRNAISDVNSKDSLYELFNNKKASRLTQVKESVLMAFFSLKRVPRNVPDSTVNGNLVNWMEHSMHIALFSPAVAGAIYDMLIAEADRIEKSANAGEKATISKEMTDLAKMLIEKEVWDYSAPRFTPPTKLELIERDMTQLINSLMPGRKSARSIFPREEIAHLRHDQEAAAIARQINLRYGHLSPKKARQQLEKQWELATKNYQVSKKTGKDTSYWLKAGEVVELFLTALGSKIDLRTKQG